MCYWLPLTGEKDAVCTFALYLQKLGCDIYSSEDIEFIRATGGLFTWENVFGMQISRHFSVPCSRIYTLGRHQRWMAETFVHVPALQENWMNWCLWIVNSEQEEYNAHAYNYHPVPPKYTKRLHLVVLTIDQQHRFGASWKHTFNFSDKYKFRPLLLIVFYVWIIQ